MRFESNYGIVAAPGKRRSVRGCEAICVSEEHSWKQVRDLSVHVDLYPMVDGNGDELQTLFDTYSGPNLKMVGKTLDTSFGGNPSNRFLVEDVIIFHQWRCLGQ
jgi:hypothetical protein